MPIVGNTLVAPIYLPDVYRLLGVGKRPDGFNQGYICTHPSINKDSLYKPIDASGMVVDFNSFQFGYDIPFTNSRDVSLLKGSLWYRRPVTIQRRLPDFNGYDHAVRYDNNRWGIQLVPPVYNPGESIKISCTFGNTPRLISPKNMPMFKDCYLAVSIFGGQSDNPNSLTHRWSQCGALKIGDSTGELITVQTNDFVPIDDTTLIIPFISDFNFGKGDYLGVTGTGGKWSFNYNKSQAIIIGAGSEDAAYTVVNGRISPAGSYGAMILADAKKIWSNPVTINALYAQFELYDLPNLGGNKLFSNFGLYDNTTYKYQTPISVTSPTTQPLPPASISWGAQYPTAKSIKVRIEDPYYHYVWTIGQMNL